jgi:HD-like signal output (HDOD) protein
LKRLAVDLGSNTGLKYRRPTLAAVNQSALSRLPELPPMAFCAMQTATVTPPTATAMKRILFVDDEPNVLAGLRNALRSQRRQWDMVFALGPEEALAQIAASSFDVVVSDMRMPRMDGAELLREIKLRQPKAVRVILTGQTEQESVLRSVFIAHMFLSKPCEPSLLKHVVDRACRLNAVLNSEELRAAAGRVETLPAAPRTYVELNRVLTKVDCSVRQVSQIIEHDVGLCAKILQLVNSAFFGLPRRVVSLDDAVTYLGTLTIKNLALALEAFSSAEGRCDLATPDLLALEDHSLLVGQVARQINTRDRIKAEEAFLAGLLHEVGCLVRLEGNSSSEKDAVDRALLGAYLLGLWGLPHPIIEAVAYHHDPRLVTHSTFDIVDAVYVAHHLVAEEKKTATTELDLDYLAAVGITKTDIDRMRAFAAQIAGARAA